MRGTCTVFTVRGENGALIERGEGGGGTDEYSYILVLPY